MRATRLRAELYRVLDHVLATGEPIEIERKDGVLKIVPVTPASKLDRLVPRPDVVVGDPDDLVHLDWSSEWKP
jgi:hypothetical protein